jgi:hypothetical protein
LPGERDRFETTMRMYADASLAIRRRIHVRRMVVEEQERAELAHDIGNCGEVAGYPKAIANPVQAGRGINALDEAVSGIRAARVSCRLELCCTCHPASVSIAKPRDNSPIS